MKVLIIGGDRRMLAAREEFKNRGFKAETLGLTPDENGDISHADVIVLPAPATRDSVNINCTLTSEKIPLNFLSGAQKGALVFGGGKLDVHNYTNYLSLDEYAFKNAVLTAEGAIAYVLNNTDFSLWKSRILIVGYGRCGKLLTERLVGFKPDITVSARSRRDFAILDALGIRHIETSRLCDTREQYDIIFNTVDIKLDFAASKFTSPTLFADLSTSGGFSSEVISGKNINYIKLPGLPGKTAYKTAGKIIAETVIELLGDKPLLF